MSMVGFLFIKKHIHFVFDFAKFDFSLPCAIKVKLQKP